MRKLNSQIQELKIPNKLKSEEGIKHIDLLRGSTSNIGYLRCHMSVLNKGLPPHPPHKHSEEEVLILLQGEVDVIIPDLKLPKRLNRHRLQVGQCVYYPAGFRHTIETVSEKPASYVMFKWHGSVSNLRATEKFNIYTLFNELPDSDIVEPKIKTKLIFEGSTSYLKRLHCHTTKLAPSVSYSAHADQHDVAILVFQGELETLGQNANPYDIIFYKSGDPHGMSNTGENPAFYAVLEFHCEKPHIWPGYHNLKRIILSILNEPESFKPRLKHFFNRLRKFR